MKPYTIAIAGSTEHTLICAEVLHKNPEFSIPWTLTPNPKTVGRAQTLTENPLHRWSQKNHLANFLVTKKIDSEIQQQIEAEVAKAGRPDFLLVVDFGYIVPDWLLKLPAIAPLNIHPSLLPKWRGSSPGQFVLLYGEKTSAVTLMEMNAGLDTGPIIHQEKFTVEPTWTQTEYYKKSFELISAVLAEKIIQFAKDGQKITQPEVLPTPIARRLKKEDGFVAWPAISGTETQQAAENLLLAEAVTATGQSWPEIMEQASRALTPWPTLWTLILTAKGEKRMQIVKCHLDHEKLVLDQVKIEGQGLANWSQVKNQIQEK